MSLLLSQPDYERWLYAIPATYASVRTSTLRFFTTSAATATVAGSIFFHIGYDPQPHPNDPTLASTAPHHKHVPPDIKHHRIPAPGLSFDRPNLPLLIEEIERAVASG